MIEAINGVRLTGYYQTKHLFYKDVNDKKTYFRSFFPEKISDTRIISHGIFSAKYDSNNKYPENVFGLDSWKGVGGPCKVEFFENTELLFSIDSHGNPSVVIHGDGLTKENTFFTIFYRKDSGNCNFGIYDMTQKFIRDVDVGGDCFVEFKRVNDKYAICLSQECCTYSPFTALFDLDVMFGIKDPIFKNPYDDSRVHVPLDAECGQLKMLPIIATNEGIVVRDVNTGDLSTVSYENLYQNNLQFYSEDNSDGTEEFLTSVGLSQDQIENLKDLVHKNGSVSIKFKEEDN